MLGQFADLRREGGLPKKGWCFRVEGGGGGGVGGDTPMHAMYLIWCLYG